MLPAGYPRFLAEVKARIAAAWTRAVLLPYVLTTSNDLLD